MDIVGSLITKVVFEKVQRSDSFGMVSMCIVVLRSELSTFIPFRKVLVPQVISPIVEFVMVSGSVSFESSMLSVAYVLIPYIVTGVRMTHLVKLIFSWDQSALGVVASMILIRSTIASIIARWISACSSQLPSLSFDCPSCRT